MGNSVDTDKNPLVSIIVITYNNAKFVLETLESAKAQTYQNIELIVSDDGSTDNTIQICRDWIAENQERFVRTAIVTASVNTGIPANCNRGVRDAEGEWVKLIAGDDILVKNALKDAIELILINPKISVLSLSVQFFNKFFSEKNFGILIKPEDYNFFSNCITIEQQYNILLRRDYVWGSGLMMRRTLIDQVGYFDEKYRSIEDWPILLKISKAGFRIYGTNILGVYYRRHEESILCDPKNQIFTDFYRKTRTFHIDYIYPELSLAERFADNIEYLRRRLFDLLGLNRNTRFCRWLFLFTARFNPARFFLDYKLRSALKLNHYGLEIHRLKKR